MYDNEEKITDNKIIAEGLIRILENQIEIKKHFGLATNDYYYGDCYYDKEIIRELQKIE